MREFTRDADTTLQWRHAIPRRKGTDMESLLAAVTLAPGGIIGWIVVGLIAGWLASSVMGSGYGLLGDLIIGLVGAFIGGLIVGAITTGTVDIIGSIVVAFIGAVILIGVSRLLTRGRTGVRV
jgi:uncharacterized membrane protein YeaQ/YmgE (transglycosylase-associated protein family)